MFWKSNKSEPAPNPQPAPAPTPATAPAQPAPAAGPAAANGVNGAPPASQVAAGQVPFPASLNSKLAPSFGKLVSVFMSSPQHKTMSLEQLSEKVVPALAHNQFVVAEAKPQGKDIVAPVGLVLWARVSDELDRRIEASTNADVALKSSDWASGERYWILETVGSQPVLESMLTQLIKGPFAGKPFKLRQRDASGHYTTHTFNS